MPPPLRLALVEDHAELRQHLAARLGFFPRIRLVAAVASAEALLDLLADQPPESHPQVVLMDIGLPGQSGIEATATLRARHPHVEVLMLTVFEDVEHLLQAIRAGASGYLLKDASAPRRWRRQRRPWPAATCSRTPPPTRSWRPRASSRAAGRP